MHTKAHGPIDYEAICFGNDLGKCRDAHALCRKYCPIPCQREAINVVLSSVFLGKLKSSDAPAERLLKDNAVSQLLCCEGSTFGHDCICCCYGVLAVLERQLVLVSLLKADVLMKYSVLYEQHGSPLESQRE